MPRVAKDPATADAERLALLRPVVTVHPAGSVLAVMVTSRSGVTTIDRVEGEFLRVRVAAPPVEGAANAALVRYLATLLGVPRSSLTVLSGQTGRRKRLLIAGIAPEALCRRLGPHLWS